MKSKSKISDKKGCPKKIDDAQAENLWVAITVLEPQQCYQKSGVPRKNASRPQKI